MQAPLRRLHEWLRRIGVAHATVQPDYANLVQPVELVADASRLTNSLLGPTAILGTGPIAGGGNFVQWKIEAADRRVNVRYAAIGASAGGVAEYKTIMRARTAVLANIGHRDNMADASTAGDVRCSLSWANTAAAASLIAPFPGFPVANTNYWDGYDVWSIRPGEELFGESIAVVNANAWLLFRVEEEPAA